MHRLGGRALALGMLLGALAAPPAQATHCPGADAELSAANERQITAALTCVVDKARANTGASALRQDDRLVAAAQRHSDDMADNSFISHAGSDGSTHTVRASEAGYPSSSGVAEVLGAGARTPRAVVALWLKDDAGAPSSNCRALLGAFSDLGGAGAFSSTATHKWYWTVKLGTVGGTAATSACPHTLDSDQDAVADTADNCPDVPNPGQENVDTDSKGDLCDPDQDTTGPLVAIHAPTDGSAVSSAQPVLSGTRGTEPADEPDVRVRIYETDDSPATWIAQPPVMHSGATWTAGTPAPLPDGVYEVEARQVDQLGHVTLVRHPFTVDTVAPAPEVTAPAAGATTDVTPDLAGTAGTATGDAGVVVVEVFAGPEASGLPVWTVNATVSGGAWSVSPAALDPGVYSVRARQTDHAGNEGTSAARSFSVENAPGGPTDPSGPPADPSDQPGGPAVPPRDTTAPTGGVARKAALEGRVLRVTVTLDEAAALSARLLARGKRVAKLSVPAEVGRVALAFKLSRKALRRLRGRKAKPQVVIVATDAAGNAATLRRTLKIKRR